MICENCGREMGDGERICPHCDYRTFTQEEPIDINSYSGSEVPPQKPFDKSAAKSPDEYFFTNDSYGETEPFDPTKPSVRREPRRRSRPRRRRSVPCAVVTFITFFTVVANFFVPFMTWISYSFNIADYNLSHGSLNLIDLTKQFMENDGIVSFVTGFETEWNVQDILPEQLINSYSLMRVAALILAGAIALSLLMYVIYLLMLLFHTRRSAGVGISAAFINGLSCFLFLKAVEMVNTELESYRLRSYSLIMLDVSRVPQTAVWLSIAVAVLCIVIAVIDSPRRRERL